MYISVFEFLRHCLVKNPHVVGSTIDIPWASPFFHHGVQCSGEEREIRIGRSGLDPAVTLLYFTVLPVIVHDDHGNEIVVQFPIAAITNYHKRSGIRQHEDILLHF